MMSNFEFIDENTVEDEYDVYIRCPYDGCDGACPYWILLEGLDGIWCISETWQTNCVLEED